MKPSVKWLIAWCVVGVAGLARAAEPAPSAASPVVVDASAGCWTGPSLPWARSGQCGEDATCCRDRSLHCPIELYFRSGPAFLTGDGVFEDDLSTGWALQGGAKSFWPASDPNAAWFGELGVDYVYNNGEGEGVASLGRSLRELHRVHGHVAGGYEYQWNNTLWSADLGGRLGHAHAKFNALDAIHVTDISSGVFFGLNAGVLIECRCYDLVLGGRFEWSHDWLDVDAGDDDLSEVTLLLSAAIRY